MCGICGFVTKKNVTLEQLNKMNDAMIHRGPDDAGAEIFPFSGELRIGLAHRRLSILDLSANGHQPFHSAEHDIIVVFNGEIYNFLRLKEELTQYSFVTDCDTEVIVAAYKKWGRDFVRHIDGMFAIALYDRTDNTLLLVRDRMGKKPLYYHWENSEFIFSSTLKPIMNFPDFRREVDRSVLPRFLYNQYLAGEDCILEGVRRVRPGEMLIFDGKSIRKQIYWSLIEQYHKSSADQFKGFAQSKEELKAALTELKAQGVEITAENPIYLDIPYRSDSTTNTNQKNAMKQSIEAATNGCIKVNLVEFATRDDYLAATYRFEVGCDANFDLNDGSGWGPDYGDPSTYLGTMLPDYAGYMTKSLGIF